MTPRRLLARSLFHYRAVNSAVAVGVGVGTAVLAGALIVGSSVRGSLRDLTLDRLGSIDFALVGERYFQETMRDAVAEPGAAAAGILIRGSAEHADTGARASRVRIHGVDSSFWGFFNAEGPELGNREIAINRRLADELGSAEGDTVLLRFHTESLIPAESVMGRKADSVRMFRLQVAAVLDNSGPGRFGLSPQQQLPYNAFVPKEMLQRSLDQPGRANALFVSGGTLEAAQASLRSAFTPEDARIAIRRVPGGTEILVESDRIVLEQAAADAIREASAASGLGATEVLTYLANSMDANDQSVPYSTVTALQALPGALRLVRGARARVPRDDEILINEWTADQLGLAPDDEVKLTYYVVGPGSELETSSHDFRVAGIVRMTGAAVDRHYAPTYQGMSDKERMSSWDPPFPVDLRLIRPQDEEYWDRYRAAPKAFVSLGRAKELWSSRFGQLTSFRLAPPSGVPSDQAMEGFRAALSQRLDPAAFGLSFQPVKRIGLDASAGATDFSGLFIGFSLFLIASAAILVALLFRLGVELRSQEVGTLLATGQTPGFVRRMLFAEGSVLAVGGCLVGVLGAMGYAKLMLYGLSTWWSGAVGVSFLELHLRPVDLVVGVACTLALMLLSIWLALRRLTRLSPYALLSGKVEPGTGTPGQSRRARRLRLIAGGAGVGAIALLALSLGADSASRLAAFFGAGTLSLAASLVFFRATLLSPPRGRGAVSSITWLGIRNGGRNPTRSVLCAALVACAAFMIVTVAMNRQDVSASEPAFDSGDGGFRLFAEADAPLFRSGIDEIESQQAGAMSIMPLRVRTGEDASCLNLYQPKQPTLASVPARLIERGGFAFQATLAESEAERANPWLLLEKDFDGRIPVFGDANSVTWILHLGLGQELAVEDADGGERRLVLAGLLSRSIFQSELVMSERHFLDLFSNHTGYQALLVETEATDAAATLENAFAEEGLDATRTSERLAAFLVVENTYLSTFLTLGGLGLLLGTLGLAVVMVRSVLERRGELALLEALGLARGSISRLIFTENSFLLVLGVGIGTASALLAVAPHLASSAADPPWASVLLMLGVIVAVGLLAGGAAVALSMRAPLLASLCRD